MNTKGTHTIHTHAHHICSLYSYIWLRWRVIGKRWGHKLQCKQSICMCVCAWCVFVCSALCTFCIHLFWWIKCEIYCMQTCNHMLAWLVIIHLISFNAASSMTLTPAKLNEDVYNVYVTCRMIWNSFVSIALNLNGNGLQKSVYYIHTNFIFMRRRMHFVFVCFFF